MMIAPDFVGVMARYNAWQNDNLITATDSLDDAARREDRGAFFGSIFATFNHLLWGDRIWLSRFTDVPGPTQDAANHTHETPDGPVSRPDVPSRINAFLLGPNRFRPLIWQVI